MRKNRISAVPGKVHCHSCLESATVCGFKACTKNVFVVITLEVSCTEFCKCNENCKKPF